ncbi:MAG: glycosyltransferase 87 family protein [Acidimicrobiales bacterium]
MVLDHETLLPAGSRGAGGRRRHLNGLLWLVGAVSVVLALVRVFFLVWHRSPLDFDIYMMGGSHFFGGHLYTVRYPSPQLGFTYPPFSALAFSPLALVPRQPAQYLWGLVDLAALAGLLALSLRAVRPAMSGRELTQWSLVLMTPAIWLDPVKLTFSYGQVNIVLAVLVLADLTGRVRIGGHVLPEGVLTGLAAAAKLTPLIFVPYLFLVRRARSAAVALATFVGAALVVAVLGPSTSWEYWTKYAFDAGRVGSNSYISNQSLSGVLERVHHGVVAHSVYYGMDLVLAVAGMALAVWAYRQSSHFLGLLVCATVGMVVSPITWVHHMVWIVPILLWLSLAGDRPRGGRLWAGAAAVLFWTAPIWSLPYGGSGQELHEHGWQVLLGNSYFLAMMVFLLGVALMLLRRSHPSTPAAPRDRGSAAAAGAAGTTDLTGPAARPGDRPAARPGDRPGARVV